MGEKAEAKKYVLMEADGFVPQIIDEERGYGIMVVRLDKCKYCGEWMLTNSAFPGLYDPNAKKKQMARARWKIRGIVGMQTLESYLICEECVKQDKRKFKCVICGEEKTSDKIEKCIGYPAQYLCTDCYSDVSAKEWDEKVEELEEKHKWDGSS